MKKERTEEENGRIIRMTYLPATNETCHHCANLLDTIVTGCCVRSLPSVSYLYLIKGSLNVVRLSENCKRYSSLPPGAVVSLFCESVKWALPLPFVLLLNWCLLLFISLSTQSGNFWIHPLLFCAISYAHILACRCVCVCVAHPASYIMGTGCSFPGSEAAGSWSWWLTSI
jgi:hypothetical protein